MVASWVRIAPVWYAFRRECCIKAQFPLDRKGLLRDGGQWTRNALGKAQYVKAWGEDDEMRVLLDR